MSKTCPNCNNIFDDSYNICPRCGMQYLAPAQPMPEQPNAPYNQPGTPYGQPAQPYYNQPAEQPMTLGQWVGTILLTTCLGTISLILLFVWGFSSTTPTSKKNYCRAMLIVDAIVIAFAIIFFIIVFAAVFSSPEFSEFWESLEKMAVYHV